MREDTRPEFKVVYKRYSAANPAPQPAPVVSVGLARPSMSKVELEQASLVTKARRLRGELGTWIAAGLPLVSGDIRRERTGTCKFCPFFDPKGNWGLGECRSPGCGCSKIKAALATSKCPQGRWAR